VVSEPSLGGSGKGPRLSSCPRSRPLRAAFWGGAGPQAGLPRSGRE